MVALKDSPKYKNFIEERNKTLEILHTNAQLQIKDVLNETFSRAVGVVAMNYKRLHKSLAVYNLKHEMDLLEKDIDRALQSHVYMIAKIMANMKKYSFLLSHAATTEAIGIALNKNTISHVSRETLETKKEHSRHLHGTNEQRVMLYMSKIKVNMILVVQRSLTFGYDQREMLEKLFAVLPKKKVYRKPKRVLKNLKEAGRAPASLDMGSFFIPDEEWDALVQDYLKEYIPFTRSPEAVVAGVRTPEGMDYIYEWELERDVTQSFVEQVRDGELAAAKENGIMDFVWIAVVDDRTDECCLWRDGLTTKQIEAELKGSHKDDECDGIVPPIHFNCRCDLSPTTDAMPEAPASNAKEFDEWLQS